jgi:hypothetical protein
LGTSRPALPACLLLCLLVASAARGDVALSSDDERPLRDTVVRLHVDDDGAPAPGYVVRAVYRPNSQTAHTEILTAADATGTVLWTPLDAGPVTLTAWPPGVEPGTSGAEAAASLTVAVRFGGFPGSGLVIMILAGLLLFGGAAAAFAMLLRPPSHLPAEEPPST